LDDKILDLFKSLFEKMLDWFVGPFQGELKSLKELIFQANMNDTALYYGVFDAKQWEVVKYGMAIIQSLSVGIILVSIIIVGMRISSAGINPSNRTAAIEYLKDFLIVGILFFNLSTLFELIFTVNSIFVTAFQTSNDFMNGNILEQLNPYSQKGPLGTLVIGLIMLGLWMWANFYYMMRTLTLMIFTIMSPLVVALYLIPHTKGITGAFLKEYTGTVFVQSIHAALFWIVASIATADFGIGSVLLYIIFIPLSESIRSLLGMGGQMNDRLTKTAAMFGGAALSGVYGSIKGALNGQSVAQALRGATGQVADKMRGKNGEMDPNNDPKTMLGGAGTDIGSTARAERMLKAGEILSKGGKAVFGAAGAIAGSPMGPMGAIAGSTLGFSTGGAVAGVAGRAGWAGAELVGHRLKEGIKAGWNKGKGLNNAETLADEKLANAIAEDETTNWANQNREEFMKENKARFPDLTDASREQMWQDKVAGKRADFQKDARTKVGELKSIDGQMAKGSALVESATENLTNDWAKKSKNQFMSDYDKNHPLPAEATEADIIKHNQNKNAAWQQALSGKRNSFNDIAKQAVSKLSGQGIDPILSKDDFTKQISAEIGSTLGGGEKEGALALQAALGTVKGLKANGKTLAKATVDHLTNDWARNNKANFNNSFDANNPIPSNASEADLIQHKQNKTAAWQQAVEGKRKQFSSIADKAIESLSPNPSNTSAGSYINKEAFAKEVGLGVSAINGTGERESMQAVKAATSSVKGASLYSMKAVNTEYLQNHLASQKAGEAKDGYIQRQMQEKGMSKEQAVKSWDTTGRQQAFETSLDNVQQSMPQNLKLDHAIVKSSVGRGLASVGGGLLTGTIQASGIPSGIQQASSFISDTKLGVGIKSLPQGIKTGFENRSPFQNPVTATVGAIGEGMKLSFNTAKEHSAQNVIGKQIGFKNTVAFATGIVGGVRGYRAGANYASGGTTNTQLYGLKGFNPYNNAVNEQVSEISQIQQMAQTVTGPNGQPMIASGAVRMVTTRQQTVIQVKDKSGRVQTVSRIGSGDSGLRNGQTIYQDLTIQDGQFAPESNVYQEDSAGGRITSSRRINVNPNRIVANRNKPSSPRVVKDVQSYNQLVDSGQYYLQDAMKDMDNIKMVIDRSRSYLVGQKDGNNYRISQYGPGDTRLNIDEVITRTCEERNNKLVLSATDDSYTSSLKPIDLSPDKLAPHRPPNKRNITRHKNEVTRNKSFTGSLG